MQSSDPVRQRNGIVAFRVIACGSRTWLGSEVVERALLEVAEMVWAADDFVIVIHGAAVGADSISAEIASRIGCAVLACPADWNKHGKAAGPIRNREMLKENPQLVLAFWDGKSRGTQDMIEAAVSKGIPVNIYFEDGARSYR